MIGKTFRLLLPSGRGHRPLDRHIFVFFFASLLAVSLSLSLAISGGKELVLIFKPNPKRTFASPKQLLKLEVERSCVSPNMRLNICHVQHAPRDSTFLSGWPGCAMLSTRLSTRVLALLGKMSWLYPGHPGEGGYLDFVHCSRRLWTSSRL